MDRLKRMTVMLTHRDTLDLLSAKAVSKDIVLLPPLTVEAIVRPLRGVVLDTLPWLRLGPMHEELLYREMFNRYEEEYLLSRCRPRWLSRLPRPLVQRMNWELTNEREDPLAWVGEIPHTGISYMVREGGFVERVVRTFGIFRLANVKQLGYLHMPTTVEEEKSTYHMLLNPNMNRYVHVLDVMVIARLIGRWAGFNQRQLKVLTLVGVAHDAKTVAGGDTTKNADPLNLDEDELFEEFFTVPEVLAFLKEEGISIRSVRAAVKNIGLVGQALDYGDKRAYIGRDIDGCRALLLPNPLVGEPQRKGLRRLRELIKKHPYICGDWDAFRVRDGKLVSTDPERLGHFLLARTLMFTEVYANERSRFAEHFVSVVLIRNLMRTGRLTKEKLLRTGDEGMEGVLNREYGVDRVIEQCMNALPRCRNFKTRAQAEEFVGRLHQEGNPFALIEENSRHIKSNIGTLVADKSDRVVPFYEAMPREALEIDNIARAPRGISVYYLKEDPVGLSRQKLAEIMKSMKD